MADGMKHRVSVIVPTRNEEDIVEKNLQKLLYYLRRCKQIDRFEIVVSDFSEDTTPAKVRALAKANPEVRLIRAQRKGIGAGLKAGFDAARLDEMMLYPIDLSWGMDVIPDSLVAAEGGAGVVLGSRAAKGSVVERPLKRQFFSSAYNLLVRIFYGLRVGDTQGTVLLKKTDYERYASFLEASDPFLQTELLIYSNMLGLKIVEIPVTVSDLRASSKVDVFSTSCSMLKQLISKKIKMTFGSSRTLS